MSFTQIKLEEHHSLRTPFFRADGKKIERATEIEKHQTRHSSLILHWKEEKDTAQATRRKRAFDKNRKAKEQ